MSWTSLTGRRLFDQNKNRLSRRNCGRGRRRRPGRAASMTKIAARRPARRGGGRTPRGLGRAGHWGAQLSRPALGRRAGRYPSVPPTPLADGIAGRLTDVHRGRGRMRAGAMTIVGGARRSQVDGHHPEGNRARHLDDGGRGGDQVVTWTTASRSTSFFFRRAASLMAAVARRSMSRREPLACSWSSATASTAKRSRSAPACRRR